MSEHNLPSAIGKVAEKALFQDGIETLDHAAKYTEEELLAIHGVGPKAVRIIKEELAKDGKNLRVVASNLGLVKTDSPRIYSMSVASVYPLYIQKAEKKGRTKEEIDEIIRWLTGYSQKELDNELKKQTDFETFFASAPKLNPSRKLITGVVCGVRVEDIKEPTMQEIRYLDKLVDELAKGKPMSKILR